MAPFFFISLLWSGWRRGVNRWSGLLNLGQSAAMAHLRFCSWPAQACSSGRSRGQRGWKLAKLLADQTKHGYNVTSATFFCVYGPFQVQDSTTSQYKELRSHMAWGRGVIMPISQAIYHWDKYQTALLGPMWYILVNVPSFTPCMSLYLTLNYGKIQHLFIRGPLYEYPKVKLRWAVSFIGLGVLSQVSGAQYHFFLPAHYQCMLGSYLKLLLGVSGAAEDVLGSVAIASYEELARAYLMKILR